MITVKKLLAQKGSQVWSVTPQDTILHAVQLMAEKNIGAVLVMEQDAVAGILSERDCTRRVLLPRKDADATLVGEVMTPKVIYIRPENSMEACMAVMTEHRIRHLPVLDEDEYPLGIITLGDVVKEIIHRQRNTIERLENWVTGRDEFEQ
ncbi:MAG: CBS domain-containing protein [Anaerolineales bacterium]